MQFIDPSASIPGDAVIGMGVVIGARATVGASSRIGHHTVLHEGASVGENCQLGDHVVLHPGARIGNGVRIDDHASIGKQPMRAANSAVTGQETLPPCDVGDRCMVGTGAVIYAGCRLGERVLVADLATLREHVTVGDFTIVGRGVAVENHCSIGAWCKLETNVYITAWSTLEDRVFVAPGTLTSNDNYIGRTEERFKHFKGVTVRRGGRLGVGSVILPGKTVEADAVVAAGAVLTRDAQGGQVYAGIPARRIRAVPEDQLLDNQGWD